jgi:hypothetical protein
MRSFTKPTDEAVDRAIGLMTDPEHKRYFLDRLDNPEWVKPLHDRGFFGRPPAPVLHEEEGTISFPPWAESRYLARMAMYSGEDVLAVIEAMPETENVRVHEDCTDAALAMAGPLAARVVPLGIKWLSARYQLLLPEKLGLLMEKLARDSEIEAAFALAAALLDVAPDPAATGRGPDGTTFGEEAAPRVRFQSWEYGQLVKDRLPALADRDAARTAALLSDKLEAALCIESRGGSPGRDDLSWIWRPAVEDHEQNSSDGLKDYLVEGIRDSAMSAALSRADTAHRVLDELEARPSRIFSRIALHVLCEAPDADSDRLEARLQDRGLFHDPGLWHEYYRLLARHFGGLHLEAQRLILSWVDEKGGQHEGEPDDDAQNRRHSQLRALMPIHEFLPEEWRGRYDALLAEFGEVEHPSFHFWHHAAFTGPNSPRSVDDLTQLSATDLVAFLRSWQSSGRPSAPSPRGLARALREAASSDPSHFAALSLALQEDVDPTYVAGVLAGLTEACREGRKLSWGGPLSLCAYVSQRPRDHQPIAPDAWDADQDWGQARQGAARLLGQGLQKGDSEIPFELRAQVWQALEPLTNDPDPTPEHEREYSGGSVSPYQLAINTVRGTAFEAVVLYALWCMRGLHGRSAEDTRPPVLDALPEVRQVLDHHLDPAADPSPAVRSVYGQCLPWLVLLSPSWVTRQIPRMFPTDPGLSHLRDAAWDTYVTFCRPYDTVFEVIQEEYSEAVKRLPQQGGDLREPDTRGARLGEHIVVFYARGKIALDDDDSLVRRFFECAPASIRAAVVGSIGWQLRQVPRTVSSQVCERLRHLWEFRVRAAAGPPKETEPAELLEFFSWFASGVFEPGWSLATLQTILEITEGRSAHGKQVLERLASLAQAYPRETTSALVAMVEGEKAGSNVMWWREELRAVLAAGVSSPDVDVSTAAAKLIHRLGSRGLHQFRDLLGRD